MKPIIDAVNALTGLFWSIIVSRRIRQSIIPKPNNSVALCVVILGINNLECKFILGSKEYISYTKVRWRADAIISVYGWLPSLR